MCQLSKQYQYLPHHNYLDTGLGNLVKQYNALNIITDIFYLDNTYNMCTFKWL